MDGADLYDYVKSRKFKLNEDRIREIALHIGQGIQYLHSVGIVHRDLKLENIMMTDSSDKGIAKLGDFGLSKILAPKEKSKEVLGTLGYCAPEIL
jgi:serine/threonine protein kinase